MAVSRPCNNMQEISVSDRDSGHNGSRFRIDNKQLIEIVDSYRTRTFAEDIEKIALIGGLNLFQELL